MRRAVVKAICLAAPILTVACGPTSSGVGSAELNSLFEAVAYPGAQLVEQDAWGGPAFGPITTPGNAGSRVYLVDDPPGAVQDHYIALAKKHQWTFEGPADYDLGHTIGHLKAPRYHVTIRTDGREIAPDELTIKPSPRPWASPSPSASPRAGSYRLRIDASVTS